jgi:hypothetical protein
LYQKISLYVSGELRIRYLPESLSTLKEREQSQAAEEGRIEMGKKRIDVSGLSEIMKIN